MYAVAPRPTLSHRRVGSLIHSMFITWSFVTMLAPKAMLRSSVGFELVDPRPTLGN